MHFYVFMNKTGHPSGLNSSLPYTIDVTVDYRFLILKNSAQCKLFFDCLNSRHTNNEFTLETSINDSLPFLDLLIKNGNDGLFTEIERESTFTGLGVDCSAFIPEAFKINSITTLLHRYYALT